MYKIMDIQNYVKNTTKENAKSALKALNAGGCAAEYLHYELARLMNMSLAKAEEKLRKDAEEER